MKQQIRGARGCALVGTVLCVIGSVYQFSVFKYVKSITKLIRDLLSVFNLSVLVLDYLVFDFSNKKIFIK